MMKLHFRQQKLEGMVSLNHQGGQLSQIYVAAILDFYVETQFLCLDPVTTQMEINGCLFSPNYLSKEYF